MWNQDCVFRRWGVRLSPLNRITVRLIARAAFLTHNITRFCAFLYAGRGSIVGVCNPGLAYLCPVPGDLYLS